MRFASALFSFALLIGASLPASAADSVHATPDTMLIVGDSLSSAHRMAESDGWVALLSRKLAANGNTPPAIVNASRGGKTLTDALQELPPLLSQHHPRVVVLELGGNDAIMGATGPQIRRDLTRLIEMAQAQGARVAVLGFEVPPAFDKDGSADLLRDAYTAVAKEKQVILLPSLLAGISGDPTLLQDDGIHPNASAQPRVLDNAWPTLHAVLEDNATVVVPHASK
ncbi:GDSL-type esterase/lipase family protein [Lysobacter sp. LF1]|uniref:GDSL-type esterase/lipase family protein n=1 Tax=Lysobacter stagni TaxID=3045172 RepID=A0ABT6XHR5_9GAMM|nr:GDSL-type esterase/lipase family protein [Lysobacter sp. LF1]MDI9239694.1 GDSL-type esterase/lipase family protein [Lysobacter sp. LF1]